jgi:Helix-turn-helix
MSTTEQMDAGIERQRFIERLDMLAEKHGGKAALAKLAGIAPTSLQNYFVGTEPPRPILLALAKATGVSSAWLAGEAVEQDGMPEGFSRIAFYDLSSRKNFVFPLFSQPSEWRVLKREDLAGHARISTWQPFMVRLRCRFNSSIGDDDDVLVDGLLADDPALIPSKWTFQLDDNAIYLIGRRSKALLRKLKRRKGVIDVLDQDAKVEFSVPLNGEEDFLFWGPIVWRCGSILPP